MCYYIVLFFFILEILEPQVINEERPRNLSLTSSISQSQSIVYNQASLDIKACIVGDVSVGKTSVINQFQENKFVESISTISASFMKKQIEITLSPSFTQIVQFKIFDTPGQQTLRSLVPMYYRNAAVIFLVYSIVDRSSFEGLNFWIQEIKQKSNSDSRIILLGNKSDLSDERVITKQEADDFAAQNRISYYEVSAKTGDNIKDVFEQVAIDCYNRVMVESSQEDLVKLENYILDTKQKDQIDQKQKCC